MVEEQFSPEDRKVIIQYGIQRGKISLISTAATLIMGLFFGIFNQSIIFFIIFCFLRRYAGGYHADSQTKCYIISFAVVIFSFLCIKYVECNTIICFLTQVICLLIILILSPVENKNRQLEEYERIKYRNRARLNAITIFGLSCYVYWTENAILILPIITAYLLVAISLVSGYIKNIMRINNY